MPLHHNAIVVSCCIVGGAHWPRAYPASRDHWIWTALSCCSSTDCWQSNRLTQRTQVSCWRVDRWYWLALLACVGLINACMWLHLLHMKLMLRHSYSMTPIAVIKCHSPPSDRCNAMHALSRLGAAMKKDDAVTCNSSCFAKPHGWKTCCLHSLFTWCIQF